MESAIRNELTIMTNPLLSNPLVIRQRDVVSWGLPITCAITYATVLLVQSVLAATQFLCVSLRGIIFFLMVERKSRALIGVGTSVFGTSQLLETFFLALQLVLLGLLLTTFLEALLLILEFLSV